MMLGVQRQNIILEHLRKQGAASIGELANRVEVSAMTVRRDLDLLEQQGLIRRTHGGAIIIVASLEPEPVDPTFAQRDILQQSAKQAIGRRAAELVEAGDQLVLDSGSTVAAICPFLEGKRGLTVITYSLPVVEVLKQQPDLNLICTGGTADLTTNSLVGPLAERVLEGVRVDKAFVGATSLSLEDGFSNSNLQNLTLQRILLRVARETYLLVDSRKFLRRSFWLVERLEVLSGVITDSEVPDEIRERLEQAGVRIFIAAAEDVAHHDLNLLSSSLPNEPASK